MIKNKDIFTINLCIEFITFHGYQLILNFIKYEYLYIYSIIIVLYLYCKLNIIINKYNYLNITR